MPAGTKVAHDPDVIAHLQSEASRSPTAYRFRLATIAIAGDLALTATQVLPWAAPILIGVVLINLKLFYWLGGAAVIFLVWLFRPSFRFQGRPLAIEEAPRLYAEMERLRQALQVPSRMLVYLDNSFNASATETRGLFGLLGTNCALTLGVPLLVALSREQVVAVIAHEFGHFSRRHGRLGHWLYRARVGWMQYAQHVDDSDSSFDRAAAWYASKFLPFFSARSFVHSRQCEYEADADAALAVGARPFAEALTRVAVIARLWEKRFPRELARWQLEQPQPPRDFYQRFERFAKRCSPGELQSWLDDALRASSSWDDTHPSLPQRLRPLAQDPVLASPTQSAAEALLGEQWLKLLAEFNDKWINEVQADWLVEHLRIRHIAQPLLSADEATIRGWSVERRLARANELCRSDPPRGLLELRELHQADPSHRQIRFAYAAALLDAIDEAGVELIESLAREDAAFRPSAFLRAVRYFEHKGDSRQVERWSAWLKQVQQNLGEAVELFLRRAEAGETRPSTLQAAERAVVSEAARLDPCVVNAWLVEGHAQFNYAAARPAIPVLVHLLVLAIDPTEVRRVGQEEDRVAERYEALLRTLIAPDHVPVVRTYFTTENIPIAYRARPDLSLNPDADAPRADQRQAGPDDSLPRS